MICLFKTEHNNLTLECVNFNYDEAKKNVQNNVKNIEPKNETSLTTEKGFYETVKNKTTIYKTSVTVTPGWFYGETREYMTTPLIEYEIVDMSDNPTPEQMKLYIKHINDIKTAKTKDITNKAVPSYGTCKFRFTQFDKPKKKYTLQALKNLKTGTIVRAMDTAGDFYLAKIIAPYDAETNSFRVHYSGWDPLFNYNVDVHVDYFGVEDKPETYKDQPYQEYYIFNKDDRQIMEQKGLCLTLEDYKELKEGDYVEMSTSGFKCTIWKKVQIKHKTIDNCLVFTTEKDIETPYYNCAKSGTHIRAI